jgi:hypothetical protein
MLRLALASLVALTSSSAFARTTSPRQSPVQTLVEPGAPLRMTGWYLAGIVARTSLVVGAFQDPASAARRTTPSVGGAGERRSRQRVLTVLLAAGVSTGGSSRPARSV